MSHLVSMICPKCGEQKHVRVRTGQFTAPPGKLCDDCACAKAKAEEEAHLAKLAELPLEERIARIERWIYHYKKPSSTGLEIIGG